MPITTCTKCGELYDARSEEASNEPGRVCGSCNEIAKGRSFTDDVIDDLRAGRRRMTPQERAYLLETVPSFEECGHSREELKAMNDSDLMTTAMWVWVDYCR